eukprot:1697476-Rhodomonas_salina.1
MKPGRKCQQMEATMIEHMQCDVLALQRQYSRPSVKHHAQGVRLRQHSSHSRQKLLPQQKTTTAPSHPASDRTAASHDSDLTKWIQTIKGAGVVRNGRALRAGDVIVEPVQVWLVDVPVSSLQTSSL